MFRRLSVLCASIALSHVAFTQAGIGVYKYVDLSVSSRMNALGGTNVSIRDNDINFAFKNPALLCRESNNVIGLNYSSYLAGIKFGSAVYAREIDTISRIGVGIQYVDYGQIPGYTDENIFTSNFTGKDMAMYLIYTRQMSRNWNLGATFKPLYSVLEQYTSFGVAADAGVNYIDNTGLFSAGLVLRNVGTQLKGYYLDGNKQHYEPLPFGIDMGFSKKFAHAPLRFSVTLHDLQTWNLSYQSTNQNQGLISLTDNSSVSANKISFFDMAFRHVIIGGEILFSKNFYLIASYNHRRAQEMAVAGVKSMAGFAFGAGIKLYKFQVGFGMAQYQVGNFGYQFSIMLPLQEFNM